MFQLLNMGVVVIACLMVLIFGVKTPLSIVLEEGLMQPDGLYRVTTSYLCAGFVLENGSIVRCAPILRRKINYWMRVAKFVQT
jgi:hypothetical protein